MVLKKLLSYIGEYKKISIITPILIAIEVIIEISIPFLMASIIDEGLNKGNVEHLFFMGIITLSLAIISMIFGIVAGRCSAKAATGFAKNIRTALFHKIQGFSFVNIDKFSTAGLITRFTTDVVNLQASYQMVLRIFVRAPFMMIFASMMAAYINLELSIIYVGAVIFLGLVISLIIFIVHPIFRAAIRKYDLINSRLQENISGMRLVKAYVREDYEIEKFKEITSALKNGLLKGERIVVFVSPLMQFTMYTCILLLSWFGAKKIIIGDLTTGQLMSLFVYTSNILMNLLMFAMVLVSVSFSRVSAERIVEVLNEEAEIKNSEEPIFHIENANIEFKNVNFSYTNNIELLNLKNINIKISQGETIGIIGAIGSSKSALVQLIPRLYDVTSGEILISGENVKRYDIKTLRDSVAMVLQKNILFSGTIKENLCWGNKNASDEDLIYVSKIAQIDEFIQRLPDKYNSYIEQGGVNISGGQRQRLCIARALLKNPKILILDDSTSSLDTKTDKALRDSLKNFLPNITKIIISQRISSVKDSDRIIVLDDGEIVGFDCHEELLKKNSIYREIYESQIEGGTENE
ncbi:ABC transporter ATP-binding protein [Fusobacterium russii]|uniref:ABC transporter ATP-binding protein n=1 Tax=Fusobacterium russii TaxID=854 RepID=UPI001FE20D23|nr:ABC transporter ATP-binding protein [Fusobacterium russii]